MKEGSGFRLLPNEPLQEKMRFDSALSASLWCGRMGLGCCSCSCGLAPLQVLLVAAADLTHKGMRWDTAGREQEADAETAWKAGLSLRGPFFFLHKLPIKKR